MNKSCNYVNVPDGMPEIQKERVIRANQVYCKACEDNGVKVCSWESFSAWKEYVDGSIGETQLTERAHDELRQFTETFKKYTIVAKEESAPSKGKDLKLERAKDANKIYKKVCADSGMNHCFFNNFATWSEYVEGRISESEFREKAQIEVEKLKAEVN